MFQFIWRSSFPDAADTGDCCSNLVSHAWFSCQCNIRSCVYWTVVIPAVAGCSDVSCLANADECDSSYCHCKGWFFCYFLHLFHSCLVCQEGNRAYKSSALSTHRISWETVIGPNKPNKPRVMLDIIVFSGWLL